MGCHPVGSVDLLQTAAESEREDEKFVAWKIPKIYCTEMSKQNVFGGNETIRLVGMTFLILKYHIKLVFQKDQYHFILKH